MFQAVLNAVLVCHHRRTTFPLTPGRGAAAALPRTYIACLDCGRELPYDWNRMRVVASGLREAGRARLEPCGPMPDGAGALQPDNQAARPGPVRRTPPVAALGPPVLVSAAAVTEDGPCPATGSGQYLVRARLRTQQVQVALRVLNTLMTGLSAQPDDVAKLKSWTDPSQQACSTRDLAQRVVTCAVSP